MHALDAARYVLGMTWEDVARASGIGRATLYHIRDSGRCPQGDTLVSLLMWLGITDVSRFVVKRDRKGHDGE